MDIKQIESHVENGITWYKVMDVLAQLDRSQSNVSKYINYIPDKFKKRNINNFNPGMPSWFITSQGVYRLILLGKTEYSENFKTWVVDKILPEVLGKGYFIAYDKITPETAKEIINELSERFVNEVC